VQAHAARRQTDQGQWKVDRMKGSAYLGAKLDRLTAMVEVLEKAAGLNPDFEAIRQGDDGSWPVPETNAPVVAERINFRAGAELRQVQATHLALEHQVDRQAEALDQARNNLESLKNRRGDDAELQ
jgi:hypothetical protein